MTDTTITVDALRDLLERGERVTVLDVRRADQRAEWMIPGSVHADVYDALWAGDERALNSVELADDRPVVAVCNVGQTSRIAADLLRRRGLEALSLQGGMRAWSLAWNTAEIQRHERPVTLVQVRRTGKGCLSYLIGSEGKAAVIDPSVGPETYLELAKARGLEIVAVIDTHVHADHLSRARALAQIARAELYLPQQHRVRFAYRPLNEGDTLTIGSARIEALRTPGHTHESTCYLLDGRWLHTGDTLFVNAVGRPDLKSDNAEETRGRAAALYDSLERLFGLPDETLVLGCHTSEPIAFDRKPIVAPLREVRSGLPLLHESKERFVEQLLARIPPTPPNHLQIVALNEAGELPAGDPTALEAGANRCAAG